MTDKELKRLNRADLLSLLLEQSREIDDLRLRLANAEAALQERNIMIQNSGSIAEAALRLNGVFEAAEQACQQYKDNIALLNQQYESVCQEREKKSRAEAERIVADAKRLAAEEENRTRIACEEIQEAARIRSQQYWEDVSVRLKALASEHSEMREFFTSLSEPGRHL